VGWVGGGEGWAVVETVASQRVGSGEHLYSLERLSTDKGGAVGDAAHAVARTAAAGMGCAGKLGGLVRRRTQSGRPQ